MNNKNEMSFDELRDLLIDNEVKNFDPVAEAFKVYDPENSGFVDTEVLRSIFESLGFGEITDDGARARAASRPRELSKKRLKRRALSGPLPRALRRPRDSGRDGRRRRRRQDLADGLQAHARLQQDGERAEQPGGRRRLVRRRAGAGVARFFLERARDTPSRSAF